MRNRVLAVMMCALPALKIPAQELPMQSQQELENIAAATEEDVEDDAIQQDIEYYRKHPLDLNKAGEEDLLQLRALNALQVAHFLRYRQVMGSLISLYELQAIPGWDIPTIRRIWPMVTLYAEEQSASWKNRLRRGEHMMLFRIAHPVQKAKGYQWVDGSRDYLGSRQRIFFRYRYQYRNLFQWGITGDKDAGERFGKGAQQSGFDFYSAHVFARKTKWFEAIALGDFTVSMGQGLIHWQGMAFNKGADLASIKRQGAVLRPYSAAGEFYFHRGAGVTWRKKRLGWTVFTSLRKLTATTDADSAGGALASSFSTSGYHRTLSESGKKNNVRQSVHGLCLQWKSRIFNLGFNSITYGYNVPVQKRDAPYNLFAFSGRSGGNASIDYSITWRNLHAFGEIGVDRAAHPAVIAAFLLSPAPTVDMVLVYRNLSPKYQALFGNAFTEASGTGNESGGYLGLTWRVGSGWRVDGYADLFRFPWLRYRVNSPGGGMDGMVQVTWTPSKGATYYVRARSQRKLSAGPMVTAIVPAEMVLREDLRLHGQFALDGSSELRSRVEMVWYDRKGEGMEKGFLGYLEYLYRPAFRPFALVCRWQYFETDGYASRVYGFESDVLYSYSVPGWFDTGTRTYITVNYDINKSCSVWVRWAGLAYVGKSSVGSGMDETAGNRRSDWRFQVRWRRN